MNVPWGVWAVVFIDSGILKAEEKRNNYVMKNML